MKVYFNNRNKKQILIGECDSFRTGEKIILEFCAEHSYKIPYIRTTLISNTHQWYDIGSHFESFDIKENC